VIIALAALAAAAACVFAFVALRRTRVSLSIQASAHERGAWALAGGGALGPVAISGGRAAGGRRALAVTLWGRTVWRSRGEPRQKEKEPSRVTGTLMKRAKDVDPVLALDLARDAFGRVRLEELDADVKLALVDPTTSGRVAMVLAVLSAMLAPVATIRHAIDWGAEEDAVDVQCGLAASFVPLSLFWDLTRFSVRQARVLLYDRRARSRARGA
jgi:hypothetical protein